MTYFLFLGGGLMIFAVCKFVGSLWTGDIPDRTDEAPPERTGGYAGIND